MKAILAQDAETPNPKFDVKAFWKALKAGKPYRVPIGLPVQAGTVIDHPDAWQLVMHGMARPGDDECRERCGLTAGQIEALIEKCQNLQMGVGLDLPEEDFEELEED